MRWTLASGILAGTLTGAGALGIATRAEPLPPARHAALALPARPALAIPSPRALAREPYLTQWAPVRRAVLARAAPARGARVLARVKVRTPEGTPNPLPILERRRDARGTLWLRVRLAMLLNGTTGWVPRRALGAYQLERDRLVVDLATLRATLVHRGHRRFSARIGVGQAQWPTPRGEFLVRNRLERYRSPAYGPVAFGTSARSATLTDWPAGGYIGIHGTDEPERLPGRVSHGCIRMRNEDILRLAKLMPVGTPVTIR
jgi:hypothetical protein